MDMRSVLLRSVLLFSSCAAAALLVLAFEVTVQGSPYTTAQEEVVAYVQGMGSTLPVSLAEREREHLADVRTVLLAAQLSLLATLAGAVAAGWLLPERALGAGLLIAGAAVLVLAALLAIAGIVAFPLLFDALHRILFAPGSWLFPAESALIQLFPFSFFALMAKRILMLAAFLGIGSGLAGLLLARAA